MLDVQDDSSSTCKFHISYLILRHQQSNPSHMTTEVMLPFDFILKQYLFLKLEHMF